MIDIIICDYWIFDVKGDEFNIVVFVLDNMSQIVYEVFKGSYVKIFFFLKGNLENVMGIDKEILEVIEDFWIGVLENG